MKNGRTTAGTTARKPPAAIKPQSEEARRRAAIRNVRHNAGELIEINRDGALNRQALSMGLSLSALLERMNPTDEMPASERTLDAFGRCMKKMGIRTVSAPVLGVWADTMERMFEPEYRGFLLEWVRRRWAEAQYGQPANPYQVGMSYELGVDGQRSILTSADEGALGGVWRPYFDMAGERVSQMAPAIPLSLIVANTTTVPTDAVRMAYMDNPSAAELRAYRVGETAEIPLSKYTIAQHEVRLYKYGGGIEISYESMRHERMDRVAFWIARRAIQNEDDKVSEAIDVIINGDGNSNGATSHNKTAMQGGSGSDALTVRGWITYLAQFYPYYTPTLALARLADYVDILTLTAPNANPAMGTLPYSGGVTQVKPLADQVVNLGRLETLPANTVVTLDPRLALEHLIELGANITESDKFITRQTEVVVMTETEGWDIMDKLATRLLVTNA